MIACNTDGESDEFKSGRNFYEFKLGRNFYEFKSEGLCGRNCKSSPRT